METNNFVCIHICKCDFFIFLYQEHHSLFLPHCICCSLPLIQLPSGSVVAFLRPQRIVSEMPTSCRFLRFFLIFPCLVGQQETAIDTWHTIWKKLSTKLVEFLYYIFPVLHCVGMKVRFSVDAHNHPVCCYKTLKARDLVSIFLSMPTITQFVLKP